MTDGQKLATAMLGDALIRKSIFVRTQFVGFHRWLNAPGSVAHLRDYHRHEFHVEVHVPVESADREVEFFTFKARVDAVLTQTYRDKHFEESCEQIATNLLKWFPEANIVCVSEDGENGGMAIRTIPPYSAKLVYEKSEPKWEVTTGVISGDVLGKFPQPTGESKEMEFKEDKINTSWSKEFEDVMKGKVEFIVDPNIQAEGKITVGYSHTPAPKTDPRYPSTKVTKVPFVGTEAEGPYRGCKTLFLPGTYCRLDLQGIIALIHKSEAIYFGSGNIPVPLEYRGEVKRLLEICSQTNKVLCIETNEAEILELMQSSEKKDLMLHFTITSSTDPKVRAKADFIKTVNVRDGFVRWQRTKFAADPTVPNSYITRLDDPLYLQDAEVKI